MDVQKELLQQQLADARRLLAEERQRNAEERQRNSRLEGALVDQLAAVRAENRELRKRKDRYADAAAKRRVLREPERRAIARRQDWRCANPDGRCLLPGELDEFDIDHITPLCEGGGDVPANMQALCPACHRWKSTGERIARATSSSQPDED